MGGDLHKTDNKAQHARQGHGTPHEEQNTTQHNTRTMAMHRRSEPLSEGQDTNKAHANNPAKHRLMVILLVVSALVPAP